MPIRFWRDLLLLWVHRLEFFIRTASTLRSSSVGLNCRIALFGRCDRDVTGGR